MHSSPPTRLPMSTIRHWHASCSSWRSDVQKETGAHIAFINLSGGVGIPYRPEQEPKRHHGHRRGRAPDSLRRSLCPQAWAMLPSTPRWAALSSAPTALWLHSAIHQKHTYKEYVGLDACAANLMRPAMYGAYHHITVLGKENAPCDHKYDVTGGLCENNDKFAVDRNAAARSTSAITFTSTTPARMASRWAITTTASCAAPRCCFARTARSQTDPPRRDPEGLLCNV